MRNVYHIWRDELRKVFSDPAAILLMLIVPLAYPLLYALVYDKEVVREVPVAVVDDSASARSRELVRTLDASPDVAAAIHAADMAQARDLVARGKACGVVYIPAEFSHNIARGEGTTVKVYADMSSILNYKAILLSTYEACLKLGAEVRVEQGGYGTGAQDAVVAEYVQGEWIGFFNPANGFAAFFIPAVLILILQQTMLIGVGTLAGTRAEDRRNAIPERHPDIKPMKAMLGRAMCYVTLYLGVSAWALRGVPMIFNLPMIGNPWTLLVFLLPFLLSCTFFCLMLGAFCREREHGIMIFAPLSVMLLFLSGVSWPWNAMPGALKAVAYLFPSTPAIQGFLKINTMGASLSSVWGEFIALWIQAALFWIGAVLTNGGIKWHNRPAKSCA